MTKPAKDSAAAVGSAMIAISLTRTGQFDKDVFLIISLFPNRRKACTITSDRSSRRRSSAARPESVDVNQLWRRRSILTLGTLGNAALLDGCTSGATAPADGSGGNPDSQDLLARGPVATAAELAG